jgi:predicted nucleic acid-binding protein
MMSVSADSTKVIADTNILLYAFDTSEPAKHSMANRLINEPVITDSAELLQVNRTRVVR